MTDHYSDLSGAPSSLDRLELAQSHVAGSDVPIDSGACHAYSNAMSMKNLITDKLTAAFGPQSLDVVDESHLHAGHAGHRPGGESHYRVHIVSEAFRGKNRVERHRMINDALAAEIKGGVHALAIHASVPGEGG